MIINNTQ
jgi:hypothetical protein